MKNKDQSLLKESTIRRFMKLAAIEPLTETFVSTIQEDEEEVYEEEKDPNQNGKMKPLEEQEEDEFAPEEDEFAPEEGEEFDAEADLEDEAPEGDVDVEALVSAIADAIESETGVEVSVEGEEELGPEDELAPEDDMAEPAVIDVCPERVTRLVGAQRKELSSLR